MSIQNMTLLNGATVSATGGTTLNFTPDGSIISGGLHLVNVEEANFLLKPQITLKYKPYTRLVDGSFSKHKMSLVIGANMLTAAESYTFNLCRIEQEVHPEITQAVLSELRKRAAQCLISTNLTNFWDYGAVAP